MFFNSPSSNQAQNIMRWVVMAFLAYVLWHSYASPPPPPPKPAQPQQSAVKTSETDCNKIAFPLFSIPLVPAYTLAVKTEDIKPGSGVPAVCGQRANIHYVYLDQKDKVLEKGDKTIVIGGGEMPRGVELALVGMKLGGERKVAISLPLASAAHPQANQSAVQDKLDTAKVSLIDVSPALPQSSFPLRAIDTVFGNGKQVACGDKVTASVSLWRADGTELFSSGGHPLTFTLGQSQVPLGIEMSMSQMMEEGTRVVLIPPGYNTPLIPKDSEAGLIPVPQPENEILVAKIELLHIGGYPVTKPPVTSLLKKSQEQKP